MSKQVPGRKVEAAGVGLLGIAGLVSLATGVRHALLYGSHDLQWTGSVLLREHVDPWAERLANYPHHFHHFSPPNYLHLLYLLLLPLSGMSFGTAEILWCAVSIAFSIASVVLLTRLFGLRGVQGALVLFLLWMSAPFRVVLEVGQISLFELFFLTLAFSVTSAIVAGCAFGFSVVKYSFSPVAGVLFLLRRRWTLLAVTLLLCGVAVLLCHLLVSTPLLTLAREPFAVSRIAVSPGLADIMTFAEYSLRSTLGVDRAKTISYGLAILASVVYGVVLSRRSLGRAVELTLVGLASLLFFKHLLYDYVFLTLPLCYALSLRNARKRVPIVAGVLIFWFLAPLLNRAANDLVVHLPALLLNCVLLTALVAYTTVVAFQQEPSTASL